MSQRVLPRPQDVDRSVALLKLVQDTQDSPVPKLRTLLLTLVAFGKQQGQTRFVDRKLLDAFKNCKAARVANKGDVTHCDQVLEREISRRVSKHIPGFQAQVEQVNRAQQEACVLSGRRATHAGLGEDDDDASEAQEEKEQDDENVIALDTAIDAFRTNDFQLRLVRNVAMVSGTIMLAMMLMYRLFGDTLDSNGREVEEFDFSGGSFEETIHAPADTGLMDAMLAVLASTIVPAVKQVATIVSQGVVQAAPLASGTVANFVPNVSVGADSVGRMAWLSTFLFLSRNKNLSRLRANTKQLGQIAMHMTFATFNELLTSTPTVLRATLGALKTAASPALGVGALWSMGKSVGQIINVQEQLRAFEQFANVSSECALEGDDDESTVSPGLMFALSAGLMAVATLNTGSQQLRLEMQKGGPSQGLGDSSSESDGDDDPGSQEQPRRTRRLKKPKPPLSSRPGALGELSGSKRSESTVANLLGLLVMPGSSSSPMLQLIGAGHGTAEGQSSSRAQDLGHDEFDVAAIGEDDDENSDDSAANLIRSGPTLGEVGLDKSSTVAIKNSNGREQSDIDIHPNDTFGGVAERVAAKRQVRHRSSIRFTVNSKMVRNAEMMVHRHREGFNMHLRTATQTVESSDDWKRWKRWNAQPYQIWDESDVQLRALFLRWSMREKESLSRDIREDWERKISATFQGKTVDVTLGAHTRWSQVLDAIYRALDLPPLPMRLSTKDNARVTSLYSANLQQDQVQAIGRKQTKHVWVEIDDDLLLAPKQDEPKEDGWDDLKKQLVAANIKQVWLPVNRVMGNDIVTRIVAFGNALSARDIELVLFHVGRKPGEASALDAERFKDQFTLVIAKINQRLDNGSHTRNNSVFKLMDVDVAADVVPLIRKRASDAHRGHEHDEHGKPLFVPTIFPEQVLVIRDANGDVEILVSDKRVKTSEMNGYAALQEMKVRVDLV